MRLIGATNFMIRAPFVVEGTILGLIGTAIPLGVMLIVYRQTVEYVMNRFELLSGIIQFHRDSDAVYQFSKSFYVLQ